MAQDLLLIIMASALTKDGVEVALQVFERGAVDSACLTNTALQTLNL